MDKYHKKKKKTTSTPGFASLLKNLQKDTPLSNAK